MKKKFILKLNSMILLGLLLLMIGGTAIVQGQEPVINATTDGIDEIVTVGSNGCVYVYNAYVQSVEDRGKKVWESPECEWTYVATADFNRDGDDEIVAVGGSRVKIYDPQIINNTPYQFDVSYGDTGTFSKVVIGNFDADDAAPEIGLVRSLGGTVSRIITYNPPSTTIDENAKFDYTDWRDAAVGDWDGDGDDDFALIYYNSSYLSGYRNWVELRKGNEPIKKIKDAAGIYDNTEWYDIASGNLYDTATKTEWVGSRNGDNSIIVQRWNGSEIKDVWKLSTDKYRMLAVGDIRGDGKAQVAMLRDTNSGNSLQLAGQSTTDTSKGNVWTYAGGLGTGWSNIAIGNLDTESQYKEVVISKSSLIRVFIKAQSSPADLDCSSSSECLDISGSFNGQIALGDLGTNFRTPIEYRVTTDPNSTTIEIFRIINDDTAYTDKFYIYGEEAVDVPLNWGAYIIPPLVARQLQDLAAHDPTLSLSITDNGTLRYQSDQKTGEFPPTNWLTLSKYKGTTPSTVNIIYVKPSDTDGNGSLIMPAGAYKATVLIWQNQLINDRFRWLDVSLLVYPTQLYLPLILR